MLMPSTLPTNAGTFALYVDGMNFPPSPDLCFEGNCWTPAIISETRLSAQIPGPALGGIRGGQSILNNIKPDRIQLRLGASGKPHILVSAQHSISNGNTDYSAIYATLP